jgi:excisionase family DNA binding protein
MTENPFEVIEKRLSGIEALLIEIKHTPVVNNEPSDRISLAEACQLTGSSKSQIYKLSMLNKIPVSHFGKRLVFSRRELTEWMQESTVSAPSAGDKMSDRLAATAKKRLKK